MYWLVVTEGNLLDLDLFNLRPALLGCYTWLDLVEADRGRDRGRDRETGRERERQRLRESLTRVRERQIHSDRDT